MSTDLRTAAAYYRQCATDEPKLIDDAIAGGFDPNGEFVTETRKSVRLWNQLADELTERLATR